jgi:DNA-binding response OmpR family regulator
MWHPIAFLRTAIPSFFPRRPDNSPTSVREPNGAAVATLVCVLPTQDDRNLLADLSLRQRWETFFAASRDDAREAIRRVQPQIVLLDRDLEPADWRYALSSLAAASNGACVLLVSRVIDEYLWNEVVSNGGYDLVRKPLSEEDVSRNVKLALSYWTATHRTNAAVTK